MKYAALIHLYILHMCRIIAILESGLIQMWKTQMWPQNGKCREVSVTEAKTISLLDIEIAFFLIGIGVFLALMSLLYEHSKYRIKEWQRRRRGQRELRKSVVLRRTDSTSDDFYSISPRSGNGTPVNNAIQRQICNAFSWNDIERPSQRRVCHEGDFDGLKETEHCNIENIFDYGGFT